VGGTPTSGTLLDLLEPAWRRHIAAGAPTETIDVEPQVLDATAKALGDLSRTAPPITLARRWPACVMVAIVRITARRDGNARVWAVWHRAVGRRSTHRSAAAWAEAFGASLAALASRPRRPTPPRRCAPSPGIDRNRETHCG
jgi:hypothetical protein